MVEQAELLRSLYALHNRGDVVELRTVSKPVLSGYFKVGVDDEELIKWVKMYPNATFYQVMNFIDPAAYSREQSRRIIEGAKQTTSDNDIKRLNWILIDCDPERMSGVSSSDEEKKHAKIKAWQILKTLKEYGFHEPIVADSGNGYHLLYRIDAHVQNKDIIKDFLTVLDMQFSDDFVKVDTAVFNPARITKLYGTMATKGANTPERPHRQSKILVAPESINATEIAVVKHIADMLPKEDEYSKRPQRGQSVFDAAEFLRDHGVGFTEKTWSGGRKLVLDQCPFDPTHRAPDSAVFILADGSIGFKCLHAHCSDKTWKDVRLLYDPDAYNRSAYVSDYTSVRRAERAPDAKPDEQTGMINIVDVAFEDKSKTMFIKSGFEGLNKLLGGADCGFAKGDVTVWTGQNGSGKSTLISQLALEAVAGGYTVDLYSGELSAGRVKNWLYLQAAGPEGVEQEGNSDYYKPKEDTVKKIDKMLNGKLYVYPNEKGSKSADVFGTIEQHLQQHSVDVVILDNMMALDYSGESKARDKYDEQAMIMKQAANLAREHNIHVHFVCHPRKSQGMISKYDISGAANITDIAANVMAIYRVDDFFTQAWNSDGSPYKGKPLPNADNIIQLLKCRWNGQHIGEILPLFFDNTCKTLSENRNMHRPYKCRDGYVEVHNVEIPFD